MKEKIVSYLELNAFCHATENHHKVEQALLNLIPSELKSVFLGKLRKIPVTGYYGNPIVVYKAKITYKEGAQEVVKNILSRMDVFDSKEIYRTLGDRVNKGSIFLRLDKQKAYLGEIKLSGGDDIIQVRIALMPHLRDFEKVKYALRLLGLKE